MYTKMKKVILSTLMLFVAVMMSAATYSWQKVVSVKLTDGNNDTYTSRFGAAPELTDAASWGAVTANLEGATVRAYTTLGGTNYEQLYLNSIENLPLTIKTYESDELTIALTALYGEIKLYDNGELVLTVAKGGQTETDSYVCTVATNSTIENRFVINYVPAPSCDYSREGLTVGRYYTICLPNAVELPEGASFWNLQYRNAEGSLAYLVEAELPLVAGRPYIFQAEATELCLEYSGNPVNGPSAYGALQGTFEDLDQSDLDAAANDVNSAIYLLFNNALWLASDQSENIVGANRAYIVYEAFEVSVPNPAPGRRVRAVPMQTNGTTAIENLKVSDKPVKLMKDGQIFILRGENLYDATGRMVK